MRSSRCFAANPNARRRHRVKEGVCIGVVELRLPRLAYAGCGALWFLALMKARGVRVDNRSEEGDVSCCDERWLALSGKGVAALDQRDRRIACVRRCSPAECCFEPRPSRAGRVRDRPLLGGLGYRGELWTSCAEVGAHSQKTTEPGSARSGTNDRLNGPQTIAAVARPYRPGASHPNGGGHTCKPRNSRRPDC